MSLFIPNTGNKKMDEAYMKLQEHVAICKTFDDFEMHFKYVAKTEDKEVLNRWLLKVLFVKMKQDESGKNHDFDTLLESVDAKTQEELKTWLQTSLEKHRRSNNV